VLDLEENRLELLPNEIGMDSADNTLPFSYHFRMLRVVKLL